MDQVNDHDEAHLYDYEPKHRAMPAKVTGITDPLFDGVTSDADDLGEIGPWFVALYDGPCRFGDEIEPGDTIRINDGEYEHEECSGDPDPFMSADAASWSGIKESDGW